MTAGALGPAVEHVLEFVQEGFHILEVAVDGGEADIGDFVEGAEAIHEEFADLGGGQFAVGAFGQNGFNLIDNFGELSHWNRTL